MKRVHLVLLVLPAAAAAPVDIPVTMVKVALAILQTLGTCRGGGHIVQHYHLQMEDMEVRFWGGMGMAVLVAEVEAEEVEAEEVEADIMVEVEAEPVELFHQAVAAVHLGYTAIRGRHTLATVWCRYGQHTQHT